ncbi:SusE domain-containing protein [Mucilaginibacter defluvii]|uniref:SusE outer membrane protein domain-containing protein n=1 Tax=Mucilaginibacter defluvii TaxID=1196019 RepID=A0ABP9G7A3_9SPHI
MKSHIIKTLAFGMMMLVLWSCKKDEVQSVASDSPASGTLKASETTLNLEKANEAETAVTFNFTEPDFGFKAAVKNTLQIAIKGSNFAAPKEVAIDAKVTSKTYTVLEFNQVLLALELPFDSATEIEARVKSEVNDKLKTIYSSTVSMSVKPYPLIAWAYVPGNYQGWNPATADSLISATGNGIYTGYIYYNADAGNNYEFKITPAKSWATAYGDGGGGSLSTSGGNLKVAGPGSYQITANLNALTYEIKKYSWGIIGSATPTGWDSDTDMKYNNGTGVWSVTLPLTVGEIKFRLNDDWGTNYGGAGGVLNTNNDNNIKIDAAGNYRVSIDINAKTYTITKL